MIARTLLGMYGSENGLMLDPFVGSGTTLAEARLYGMKSIGFDLNPVALLISKVKYHQFDYEELDNYYELMEDLSSKAKPQSFKKSASYLNLSEETAITWYTKKHSGACNVVKLVRSQERKHVTEFGYDRNR